jgi:hypothetical protein
MIYETDTDLIYVCTNTTGPVWKLAGLPSPWVSSFVPTFAQSTSTNIAKTATKNQYYLDGDVVDWEYIAAFSGAGVAGGFALTCTLPVAPLVNLNPHMGMALIANSGKFPCSCETNGSGLMLFNSDSVPASSTFWGALPNIAVAPGGEIRFHIRYRWR